MDTSLLNFVCVARPSSSRSVDKAMSDGVGSGPSEDEDLTDDSSSHDYKRQKQLARERQRAEIMERDRARAEWVKENSHFVTFLDKEEELMRELDRMRISSFQHQHSHYGERNSNPRIAALSSLFAPYINIKESCADATPESEASTVSFLAEGTEVARLLIRLSTDNENDDEMSVHPSVTSILVKPSTFFESPVYLKGDVERAASETTTAPFHVFIASERIISKIAGFHISRGAMASGQVHKRDEAWMGKFLQRKLAKKDSSIRLLALDQVSDTSNLGSIIRTAAGCEVDAIILSSDSCDAWYRRAIRVSMGHVFSIPVVRVNDLASYLSSTLSAKHSVSSFAAVTDEDADYTLERMKQVPRRYCLVLGNEGDGISHRVAQASDSSVRIGMAVGVDSFSLPVAAGILMHGFRNKEPTS